MIFDEATSALDYQSERIIQDNMTAIAKNRTFFIIAHRLSTIIHCDEILYMDQGRITESGSHNDLMALKGDYARLYNAQFELHSS